ncbi:MAG: nicotinamide riboside transporter PnuC [Saprospiraceae bacterium]|nr:nicotinamide riboside transporter PnuC [Saprospiraceae bacterium]
MNPLELIATLTGLIHVWLLTREKVIAWPFGIVSVAIYVYIFFVSRLYSDAILHVFYIGLNTYGWIHWLHPDQTRKSLPVTRLSRMHLSTVLGSIILFTLIWGYVMDNKTDADFAYFDAFTTVASLIAQFLLTRKKIDNWLIWIAVDLVAIPIYLLKGLYLTSGLYTVYLVLCISGWLSWRRGLKSSLTPVH